ncbi:MAG: tRNA preQ1(34) S-adenosylmethionine ribosyltransferase-isomerase QueA [Acidimicrobiales bacterium]
MDTAQYDYDLPDDAIAQVPIEPRDAARLLVDRGPGAEPGHCVVGDLPGLLEPGDLVVVNDTKVRHARLRLRRPAGGAAEVLLLDQRDDGAWEALVKPSRRLRPGTRLEGAGGVSAMIGEDLGDGRRVVTVEGDFEAVGEPPLPPYIRVPLADAARYQTVYARRVASAAAPTAGLHLTTQTLARCREAGVQLATIELVVGLDTFRPIASERVEDHAIHREAYVVPAETMAACERAARVVAVGTTVVRALETAAATGELAGRTSLFIYGDYPFRMVDRLLTNFHVPRTTLLALVDAFVGPRWRHLYEVARAREYRFLSFGDAMLLRRERGGR